MSVMIYKDGETSKCEPHELPYQLGAGWLLTEVEESEELTEEGIRVLGKEMGIASAHNKNIDTLKAEIATAIEANSDSNESLIS